MDKFSDFFEEWDSEFEFRKELTDEEESILMCNSFNIITGRSTIDSLIGNGFSGGLLGGIAVATIFNPTKPDDRNEVIDQLIEYYTKEEDYEKCAELVKLKNK